MSRRCCLCAGSPSPALCAVKPPVPATTVPPRAANLGVEQGPILITAVVSSVFKHRDSDRCRHAFAISSLPAYRPGEGHPDFLGIQGFGHTKH